MKRNVALFIAIILIIATGVCGCMDNTVRNKEEVESKLTTFLAEKYQSSFTVQEVYQEYDGKNGVYIRALCYSDDYEDTFSVYCYECDDDKEGLIHIGSKTYSVEDKYAEVLLQNYFLEKLGDHDVEEVFVRCKVNFVEEQPDAKMVMEDPETCLVGTNAYIRVYIITGDVASTPLQDRAEALLQEYKPYTGYVYLAVKTPFNERQINDVYTKYQHDFGNYLTNESWADSVVFTQFDCKNGLHERKTIKE